MKIKRFQTINSLLGSKVVDYEIPSYVKGKYIVDKSHFVPVAELAKSVVGQSIGKSDLSRYDFADGKDNGMSVPVARRRPELAEMSVDVRNQQKAVSEKVEAAKRYSEYRKSVSSSSSSSSVKSE